MDNQVDYITEEKKKALELELEQLKGPKRKEIIEALASAKALGDLSENAEYHNAREDQAKLEDRIKEIEKILKDSRVITKTGGDSVLVGSRVVILKEGTTEEVTYSIVGAEEADMSTGKISHKSPLGMALYNKKKGDDVTFTTPRGSVHYKIINVS
jgi:transcription elongation factor GreA